MEKFDKTIVGAIEETRPTVADLHGGNLFAQAAKKYWLAEKPAGFKPEALKTEFYDPLERDGFRFRSLLILENLQFLEKFVPRPLPHEPQLLIRFVCARFLWPNFTETASNYHVVLIALMVNVKRRENLNVWGI